MIQREPIIRQSDMIQCALCEDAPCQRACPHLPVSTLLRSIWFRNEQTAALSLPPEDPCLSCRRPCERACVRPGEVPIHDLINRLYYQVLPEAETPLPEDTSRLACDLCGVPMENPFLLGSSVIASTYEKCARAFEAGWAGASFKTVTRLEIQEASPRYSAVTGSDGGIVGFKNIEQLSENSVAENMEIFRRLKQNYPTKVIVASIMGRAEAEWGELARMCQDNGADVVELNFSCPNMVEGDMGAAIGQSPELVERFTAAAKKACSIPVLSKLTPNVEYMNPAAAAALRGGADGLTAINTIRSIVGINLHTYVSSPAVRGMSAIGGYSGNAVHPIALRFIGELGLDPQLKGMHLSAAGGVETWIDALEFLLLGASSVQVTTAVMQYGYRIVEDLISGLNLYLTEKGFSSVREVVGQGLSSLSASSSPLERQSVVFPVFLRERCVGCGRCVLSCADGGHEALYLNQERRPVLNGKKCVGCHLCRIVCPERAIAASPKRITIPSPGGRSNG